jgi:hypothetical protein
MTVPPKVSWSTMAAHRRGWVNVLVPLGEGFVARNGDGVLFLPLGQNLKQQFGAAFVEFPRIVAHLTRSSVTEGRPGTTLGVDTLG